MPSLLDRTLQHELLTQLSDNNRIGLAPANSLLEGRDAAAVMFNLQYLEEHGLVENKIAQFIGGTPPQLAATRITARGLDFLADDGGLSAALGVITIKLHHDQLLALLTSRIEASELAPAEKSTLLHKLKEQPAEALSHLTTKLVDLAFEKGPAGIQLLYTALAGS